MLEIEMKFAVAAFAPVEARLRNAGAVAGTARTDEDRYFNAPDRDFAQTDEALRLRSIGTRNYITYKGPKIDRETKTRTELELPLPDGAAFVEQFGQLLTHLGYRFVALVRKQRRLYHLEKNGFPLEFCLDDVDSVGLFVELEIVAPAEQQESAKAVLRELAAELQLGQGERRSYLEMLLTRSEQP